MVGTDSAFNDYRECNKNFKSAIRAAKMYYEKDIAMKSKA